jgi:hypothetical protein
MNAGTLTARAVSSIDLKGDDPIRDTADPDNPGESLPVLAGGNAELRITRPGAGVADG